MIARLQRTPDFHQTPRAAAAIGLFGLLCLPLLASASCRFTSVTGASFGNYNVFTPFASQLRLKTRFPRLS